MDRAKQVRRPVRSQLTKLINECKTLVSQNPVNKPSLQVKLQVMEAVAAELEEKDQKVLDIMIDDGMDEQAQDLEYEAAIKYKEHYLEIKIKIESLLTPDNSASNPRTGPVNTAGDASKPHNFKLPRIELRKFDGDLKNWLGWWSQFQKIHLDKDINDADKIQYLFQAMEVGSEPMELVSSYPQTGDNYAKAVEALTERFGREDLLLQVYVRELLKLVITNVTASEKIILSTLYNKLESHLRSLAALKLDKSLLATILFPLVESSLSVEMLRAWQRSQQSKTDGSKMNPPQTRLDLLMDFMKQEVQSEQQINLAQSGFGKLSTVSDGKKKHKKTSVLSETPPEDGIATAAGLFTGSKESCAFCDRKHESDRCVKALSMPLEEREKKIKEKRLCFRCIRGNHMANKCKAVVRCALCSGKHYPVMCPKSVTSAHEENGKEDKEQISGNALTAGSMSNKCSQDVLMCTLKVNLVTPKGILMTVRLVGDNGSQRSYIKKNIVRQNNFKKTGEEWIQNILFGGNTTPPSRTEKFDVSFRSVFGGEVKTFELLEKEVICGQPPKIPFGPWIEDLKRKGVTLTDVGNGHEDVEVLIGNDYWGKILTGRKVNLECGLVAEETILGWVLGGRVPKSATNVATVLTCMAMSSDVSNLWSLDVIGITDPIMTMSKEEEEKAALSYFNSTVEKNGNKYAVGLPWNDMSTTGSVQRPPSNREVAEKRLMITTRKLKKENKLEEYHKIFMDWQKEGFIAQSSEVRVTGHYLPHRPVFKESTTTPVRPVFDASCKVGHNPSLNETLHKGPNLLELIPSLLLRFRENAIGVTADIRKAFQMVEVREEDQDYQKFLWWEDTTCQNIKVYKHLRVVFGLTCSPFLLGAVINHHLSKVNNEDKHVAEKLKNSFYVDNCVASVNNVQEYEDFRARAIKVMGGANMKLRQWAHTFSEEFTTSPSSEDDDMTVKDELIPILGIIFDTKNDTLCCEIKETVISVKVTKRQILSVLSQVFDPIGFTCPSLLLPKLLLQKSWVLKTGWDEPLQDDLCKKFGKWKAEISLLGSIKIPRHFQIVGATKRAIFTFCDASTDSYASVCFLRSEINNHVEVRLLTAKSRLAPINRASIPRLELMACLVGVRQANMVKGAISTDDVKMYFFSDSTTALAWIKRTTDWGIFVGNRVKEIRSSTKPDQWFHVPGIHNPADLPSRGCSPNQLLESKWWEGPDWLQLPEEKWPVQQGKYDEDEIDKERKTSISTAMALAAPTQPPFSSYRKNVAVWGWVLRFIKRCRKEGSGHKFLSILELRTAEKILIMKIQKESFGGLGPVINGLSVYKDEENLYRVNTRLVYTQDTEHFKYPFLLPKNHPLVHQLIHDAHKYHCHGGVQFLMGKLREKYWILQGRRAVGNVVHKCTACKRHQAVPLEVDPAALPEGRVKISEAFSTTGVDLAGPLFLKDGSKAWIVLFTCALYRGVYLDVVTSLSTGAFMGALERFISICGRPCTVYSDNGTNFVGADNIFKTLNWDDIQERSNLHQIQWIFNPPTAAWWGGWWERLVRSVKDLLKRMLGKAKLSYDELRTCLAGVAAVINDRPLTVVTEDNGDLIPLTPNMFMRGKVAGFLEETHDAGVLSQSYQNMKKVQVQLQARFRKEYLSQLVMKANEKKASVKVGDVVLVGSDGKKRYDWPLGKIEELIRGKDGKARMARVKTVKAVMHRPLQRLYPLEISEGDGLVPVKENGVGKVSPTITKSGRVVKSPSRYGQWSHLIIN